jgi:hypothetical protein
MLSLLKYNETELITDDTLCRGGTTDEVSNLEITES